MSKVVKIHDVSKDILVSEEIYNGHHYYIRKSHWESIDLSEFTGEEIKVIERFIYKFPDYTTITEIVIGEE